MLLLVVIESLIEAPCLPSLPAQELSISQIITLAHRVCAFQGSLSLSNPFSLCETTSHHPHALCYCQRKSTVHLRRAAHCPQPHSSLHPLPTVATPLYLCFTHSPAPAAAPASAHTPRPAAALRSDAVVLLPSARCARLSAHSLSLLLKTHRT